MVKRNLAGGCDKQMNLFICNPRLAVRQEDTVFRSREGKRTATGAKDELIELIMVIK